jgi:hypothetical protein
MPDQLMFVQFPHPGREHQPKSLRMPWSPLFTPAGKPVQHARKFLRVHGSHLIGDQLCDGEVTLWGEWEPPSRAVRLSALGGGYPLWLQSPLMASPPPIPRQNTDPLVFGDHFLYSNCRQANNYQLRHLAPGSLVLFGSKKPQGAMPAPNEFVLDTVFVVGGNSVEFTVDGSQRLDVPAWVEEAVFAALRSGEGCQPSAGFEQSGSSYCRSRQVRLRLYRGRMVSEQPAGPFSFAPCRPWQDARSSAFPRPTIRLPERPRGEPWLNPNHWRDARCIPATQDELRMLWSNVVAQVTREQLYLGVRFDPPPYEPHP